MANKNVDTKEKGRKIGKAIDRKKELKKKLRALEMEEKEKKEVEKLEKQLKEKQKGKAAKTLETLGAKSKKAGKEILTGLKKAARGKATNKAEPQQDVVGTKEDFEPTGDPAADDFWLTNTFSKKNRPNSYWVG